LASVGTTAALRFFGLDCSAIGFYYTVDLF
jgi:hypothetical protein